MLKKQLASVLIGFLTLVAHADAEILSAEVDAQSIEKFKVGSQESVFGRLQFIGGLELSSDNELFGAMSAIRLSADRSTFLGVADTGHWYRGKIERDAMGVPTGFAAVEIAPILNKDGQESTLKWELDAEGLVVKDEHVFVSFERNSRIDGYALDEPLTSAVVSSLPVQIPRYEFRQNGGLEAIAKSPEGGPLKGAILAISERSVNKAGDLFAALVDGPDAGVFFVKRDPPYNVTDADFLPNGDLLVLERRFSIASGVGMRIRKIEANSIKRGATVDGEILMDVGAGHQIDNMEGISITTDDQGEIFLTLISDDNHSFLQRNLLLEFKLLSE